ncbi:MAG: hypothetical protein JO254_00890, partial [Pseudolabrys sp.]|nr:hypothetical protein [Pseudolabrys sp.]
MALSSMTGFARGHGVAATYVWAWEVKSVNAKGLDVRLRMPPGWDAIEGPARAKAAELLTRGTVYANLTVERKGAAPSARINEQVLEAMLAAAQSLSARMNSAPPSVEGILALKGVIDVAEESETEDAHRTAEAAILASFVKTMGELVVARREEGAALGTILNKRLDEIAGLAKRADAAPGRQPDAVKARLSEQIATLLAASDRFDPDRLHQEAILIAAKADIREEL